MKTLIEGIVSRYGFANVRAYLDYLYQLSVDNHESGKHETGKDYHEAADLIKAVYYNSL